MAYFLVLNGPNLNLLGHREPGIYGTQTLEQINEGLKIQAENPGHRIAFLQSNAEHELVEAVQNAPAQGVDAILINPAAFTHTSVALHDALKAADVPAVEVHLSNVHKREAFRHVTLIAPAVTGVICGFGPASYGLALQGLVQRLRAEAAA